MDLKVILYEDEFFSVIRKELLSFGKFPYLIIIFTKRKVGACIAMPIKGNVHLLFHNIISPRYLSATFCSMVIMLSCK